MEEEEIQTQKPSKLSRLVNGGTNTNGELKRYNLGTGNGAIDVGRSCPNSSRIIRVSRASGGKDRHSKVWTSKGLRDRRVRLSVNTAIQFYDIQDRLGYDQPSKAVEWLIKAAGDAINELPSLNGSFPDTPKQPSNEKRTSDSVELGFDDQDPNFNRNPNFSLSCSSNSDTSKGSGLSLSRSDVRVKAHKRARERTANLNPISQNSSFTELLTGGVSSLSDEKTASVREWHSSPMGYFSNADNSTGFPGQIQLGHFPSFSGENHNQDRELQHFPSFVSNHLIPESQQQGQRGDYSLNFTISSGLASFNRGTLQSNSSLPHLQSNSSLPHLQRFSSSNSPIDTSSNVPFFSENHDHYQFSPGLQLYGEGSSRNSDHKGKGKN